MRRMFSSLAALILVAGTAVPSLAAESFSVPIDQSAVLMLPVGAQNVMIGNPAIADVNMVDTRTAVVLGRGFGVTNMLVIDGRGRTLMNRQIVVSSANTGHVSIIRGSGQGAATKNYACGSRCEQASAPGESGVAASAPVKTGP
jgi:Flp pilus assembly secretin CpaC